MTSYLHITLGPLKGSKIRLRNNLTLGRKVAHINLKDPKASNIHARISKDSKGNWHIKDMNSRNGIFYQGLKCKSLALKEGMSILIGDNHLTLKEHKEKSSDKNKLMWRKQLLNSCNKIASQVKNQPSKMTPFNPPLSLKILEGIQAETQWYMGYGPRKVGSSSLDFRLFEGGLQDYSFEVQPTKKGPVFKTQHCQLIRLNGRSVPSEKLSDGDIISINETQIQVNFLI